MATVFNEAVSANTPALDNDIVVQHSGLYRVMVSEDTGVVFSMELTRNGTTRVLHFNEGVALVADCLYVFNVSVRPGDSINFQFGGATTVHVLNVERA
ncbi:hypothetical protein ES703_00044 [subsurface metagenome]